MVLRLFWKALIVATVMTGTAASAQTPPWERPRPEGMTEAHERYAADANTLMGRIGDAFNGNPGDFHARTWTWQRGRNYVTPVSNMDGADLTRLLNGRYFVHGIDGSNAWNVWYMDPSGVTHFCIANRNGTSREYTLDRYVSRTGFGLSGTFHWDPRRERTPRPDLSQEYGWPFVGDARTGQVASYSWDRNRWIREIGWVQDEYAAAFAERCPNLPRVAQVNNDQIGATIQEIARGARPVRGFRTAFESDPADPLTVEMLYWAHPPR